MIHSIDIDDRPLFIFWLDENGTVESSYLAGKKFGQPGFSSFANYVTGSYEHWEEMEFYIIPGLDGDFNTTTFINDYDAMMDSYQEGTLDLPEAFTLKGKEFINNS